MINHIQLAATSIFNLSLWDGVCNSAGACTPTNLDQLVRIVANAIQILLALIAALAVIMIVYGGIQYIISSGDPAKISSAKTTIVNAIIGVLLSGGAYLIIDFIASKF